MFSRFSTIHFTRTSSSILSENFFQILKAPRGIKITGCKSCRFCVVRSSFHSNKWFDVIRFLLGKNVLSIFRVLVYMCVSIYIYIYIYSSSRKKWSKWELFFPRSSLSSADYILMDGESIGDKFYASIVKLDTWLAFYSFFLPGFLFCKDYLFFCSWHIFVSFFFLILTSSILLFLLSFLLCLF